jgi:hypothetical protein
MAYSHEYYIKTKDKFYARNRKWISKNLDKVRATRNKWQGDAYKKNPKYKEMKKAIAREWYKNNKEKAKKRIKNWVSKNRDKVRESAHLNYIKNRTKKLKQARNWSLANIEKVRVYKARFKKRDVASNPEKYRKWSRDYRKKRMRTDPIFREKTRLRSLSQYYKNRDREYQRIKDSRKTIKGIARQLLGRAVKKGQIIKPKNCSKCGLEGRIHGHHPDYTKPLEVIWLCTLCHGAIHSKA